MKHYHGFYFAVAGLCLGSLILILLKVNGMLPTTIKVETIFASEATSAMEPDIYQQLGEAIASVDEDYARLIDDPRTEITPYPAPFLREYHIFQVTLFNVHKPILFYVGFSPNPNYSTAYLLTGQPENYLAMTKTDGVTISSPEQAVQYGVAYLETTRSTGQLFYLVDSIEAIKFRPNLTEQDEQAKVNFLATYRSQIHQPAAKATPEGYTLTVYAIRKQSLERQILRISPQGDIQSSLEILEQNLPLVYGGR